MKTILNILNNRYFDFLHKSSKDKEEYLNKSFKGTTRDYGTNMPIPLTMWMLSDEDMEELGKKLEDLLYSEIYTSEYEIGAQRLGAVYYEDLEFDTSNNIVGLNQITPLFGKYLLDYNSSKSNKDLIFYISGKISNLPLEEAENNFLNARREIRDKFPGAGYVDPSFIYLGENGTWDKYMEVSLELLKERANAIYMLSNYKDSKGALEELEMAKLRGYKVVYQQEETPVIQVSKKDVIYRDMNTKLYYYSGPEFSIYTLGDSGCYHIVEERIEDMIDDNNVTFLDDIMDINVYNNTLDCPYTAIREIYEHHLRD